MPKCDFNKVAKLLYCKATLLKSHVNLQHIFRTSFPMNKYGGLLLSPEPWFG